MDKVISVYYSDDDINNRCEIVLDSRDERFKINYYVGDAMIWEERFPDYSLQYVEDAAENWALGVKIVDFKLDI